MLFARVRSAARRWSVISTAGLLIAATIVLVAEPTVAAPVPWDYNTVTELAAVSGNSAPAPFVVDYDSDGDDDLLVGWRYATSSFQGGISVFIRQSDGSLVGPSPVLSGGHAGLPWNPSAWATFYFRPTMADWDGDGLLDLIYGQWNQQGISYCRNTGTASDPVFVATGCSVLFTDEATPQVVGVTSVPTGYTSPHPVDWDNDGDMDLLVGTGDPSLPSAEKGVRLYLNDGGLQAGTWIVQRAVAPATWLQFHEPDVVDINDDGKKDLLVGGASAIRQCLNVGTDASPAFTSCSLITMPAGPDWTVIDFHDWDGDGLLDLVRGDFDYPAASNLQLFGRVPIADADGDGVVDDEDNCPDDANPADMRLDGTNAIQLDTDDDGLGDACDGDDDGDGVDDTIDNCPWTPNLSQADADGDGRGTACDPIDSEPGYGSYEWEQANRMEWGRKPVIMMRVDALSRSFRYDIATSLIDTALAKNVPITIAVIPWNADIYASSASAAWLTANAPNADLEIAQHGTYHACKYTAGSGPEFECGMDEARSFNLMRVGLDSMEVSITSTPSHVFDGFVPPEDGFDSPAVEAIRALGYRYLASGFYRYGGNPDQVFEPDSTGLVHIPWTQAACGNESAPWLTTHCNPFDGNVFPDTESGGLIDRVAAELEADGVSSIIFEVASYDDPVSITGAPGSWSTTYSYTADEAAILNFGEVIDGLKALTTDGVHDAVIMTLGEYAAAKSITDDTPPTISITSPTDVEYTADLDLTVSFSAADALSGVYDVWADLDGTPIVDGATVDLATLSTGAHTLTVEAEDMAGNMTSSSVTFTVIKRPTEISYSGDSSGQYSDSMALTATLTNDSGAPLAGKTVDFTIGTQSTSATTDAGGQAQTTLVLTQASGSLTVTANFAGDTEYAPISTASSFTLVAEDASVTFDDSNPVAIEVAGSGGNSGPFSLTVDVTETVPDQAIGSPAPGAIDMAVAFMRLVPIGPGTPSNASCIAGSVTGSGYDAGLSVTCTFDDVPVNTYTVEVTIDGGYYEGSNENVLVVYDPSLGFTTGGGWFYWPSTDDKTNFGYTMKYTRSGKVSGNFLLIRHMDDGSKYRVKSNALYGLAIGEADGFGWASFSGKATYLEPGWEDAIGNHEFVVYVEDLGQRGDEDRVWLEMHDKKRNVIPSLSMDRDAPDNATPIIGGSIIVPH